MATKSTRGRSTKSATAAKQQIVNEEVVQTVTNKKLDNVLGSLATAQADVQKQLAELSAGMAAKYGELEAVGQAIALKKEELKRLHNIEANAATLDELQEEIANTRTEFEREKLLRDRAQAEEDAEKAKARKRAEEENAYKTAMDRRKAEDEFKAKIEQQQKANAEKTELLQKGWTAREEAIKASEKELAELRAIRDTLPETIKRERAAEAAVVGNSLKGQYAHEAALARKDAETSARIFAQTEAALQTQIKSLEAANAQLRAQLDKAISDVKEISVASVNASSGRQALEAVQRDRDNAGQMPLKGGR